MNIQQFLLIFKARYKTVLYVTLGTVAFVLVVSLVMPSSYKASSSVVVNAISPDPLAAAGSVALAETPSYISTQSDIIASDNVAFKVVKLLKLDESPEVRQQWMDATDGKGSLDAWLATLLTKKLEVKSSPDSSVLNIVFTAEEPNFAAAVSNAFAQAYINANLELQVEPAKQFSRWYEEQHQELHDKLVEAQSNLSDYQQKTGIVNADQNLDIESVKLDQLSGQLITAKAQTADTESKSKQEDKGPLSDVLQNPVILNIKSQIIDDEAKLEALGIGKNHPQYQSIQAEISMLKQKMDSETQTILRGITTSNQVNQQKERELKTSIESQKIRALEINKQRDRLRELQNEVLVAKTAYESLSQRMAEVNLVSHANQTNVSLLSTATVPVKPAFPNLPLNIVASIFLGLVFGVGIAFIREISDRRIRVPEDLNSLNIPILMQFMPASPKRRFFKFKWQIPGFAKVG